MKAHAGGTSKLWAVFLVLASTVLILVAIYVRLPEPSTLVALPPARASVGIIDRLAIQGTLLRDPTPLFLPTEFNSSRKDYRPKEPSGTFAGFPAELTFKESELMLHLPAAAAIPTSPAEALVGDPPGAPFLGFGRADLVVASLVPRSAYVEVVTSGTGRVIFGLAVNDTHPPSAEAWTPMEFLAAVDAAGLVGPLVLTVHSNIAEVDAYFGRYLAENLRVGQRLEPGFYRISVGP